METKRFIINIKLPSLKASLCILTSLLFIELGAQIARSASKRKVFPDIVKLIVYNQENIKERERAYEKLLSSAEKYWGLSKQNPENPEYSRELQEIDNKLAALEYIIPKQEKIGVLTRRMIGDYEAGFPAAFYFPRILIDEQRVKNLTKEMKGRLETVNCSSFN